MGLRGLIRASFVSDTHTHFMDFVKNLCAVYYIHAPEYTVQVMRTLIPSRCQRPIVVSRIVLVRIQLVYASCLTRNVCVS